MNLNSNSFVGDRAVFGGGVFNQGNMSLVNNTVNGSSAVIFGHQIYNNASRGVLNLTFMANETWYSRGLVSLFATLTDDNGNNDAGQNISLLLNNNRSMVSWSLVKGVFL